MPFGHRRINEMFKLRELKHGSKYKKMVENLNYEKILNLLTVGKGKWEATKKNPTTQSTGEPSLKKRRSGSISSAR